MTQAAPAAAPGKQGPLVLRTAVTWGTSVMGVRDLAKQESLLIGEQPGGPDRHFCRPALTASICQLSVSSHPMRSGRSSRNSFS